MHRSGDPEKCPVWQFHVIYPTTDPRLVNPAATSAGIGCIECKQPVIDGVLKEHDVMRERAQSMAFDGPGSLVRSIGADGYDMCAALAR